MTTKDKIRILKKYGVLVKESMTKNEKLKVLGYWTIDTEFIHGDDINGNRCVYAKYWRKIAYTNMITHMVTINHKNEEDAIDNVLEEAIKIAKRECGIYTNDP